MCCSAQWARAEAVSVSVAPSGVMAYSTVTGTVTNTVRVTRPSREEQARLVTLGDQAREPARAAHIARIRFREGLSDFLSLLDAELTRLAAEDAMARTEADVFIRVVAVYESLGGV